MAELEIRRLTALRDNYVWLLRDPETAATGAVDPSEPGPVFAASAETGWKPTYMLNTHHHPRPYRRQPRAQSADLVYDCGPDQPALQAEMSSAGDPIATFAEVRRRRDVF